VDQLAIISRLVAAGHKIRMRIMQGTAAADEIDPAIPDERRDEIATELVNRYTAWAAAAGVIPVPLVDVVAIGGLQLQLLRKIAETYDVSFSNNVGKSLIAALVGGVLPASAAPMTAVGVTSLLKFVPFVGTTLASLSMPALSAAATYAIGRVFIQHFASGGTLLDFNPSEYREFMRAQTAKARVGRDTTASSPVHPAAS
jgi:uncharacterized protein (DUF697 family)